MYIKIKHLTPGSAPHEIYYYANLPFNRENLAAALDCLRSSLVDKIWIDAIYINQDDTDEHNAQVLSIRDILSQPLALTVWPEEGEMSGTGLAPWVETNFDSLRLCNTIFEAHSNQTLEAALGIDVKVCGSNHDYDKLEGLP